MGSKVYAVVSPLLSTAQKAVQSAHALIELMLRHPELKEESIWGHQSLVLLKTETEEEFLTLEKLLSGKSPYYANFKEPYYDNKITAFAFLENEETRKITKNLKLMIKEELSTPTNNEYPRPDDKRIQTPKKLTSA